MTELYVSIDQNVARNVSNGNEQLKHQLSRHKQTSKLNTNCVQEIESTVKFNYVSCWQYYQNGMEELDSIDNVFYNEIESFKSCVLSYSNELASMWTEKNVFSSTFSSDSYGLTLRTEINRRRSISKLEEFDNIVGKCIRVKFGISSQYFYRSMYATQLSNCFQVQYSIQEILF